MGNATELCSAFSPLQRHPVTVAARSKLMTAQANRRTAAKSCCCLCTSRRRSARPTPVQLLLVITNLAAAAAGLALPHAADMGQHLLPSPHSSCCRPPACTRQGPALAGRLCCTPLWPVSLGCSRSICGCPASALAAAAPLAPAGTACAPNGTLILQVPRNVSAPTIHAGTVSSIHAPSPPGATAAAVPPPAAASTQHAPSAAGTPSQGAGPLRPQPLVSVSAACPGLQVAVSAAAAAGSLLVPQNQWLTTD